MPQYFPLDAMPLPQQIPQNMCPMAVIIIRPGTASYKVLKGGNPAVRQRKIYMREYPCI